MSDHQQAIGIFDSGIGGLTIADCIIKQLPYEQLIYVADKQFAPYGEKSTNVIIERVNQIADFFISQNVKAIVIACNTATVEAIDQLRMRVTMPIIGVEPAIKPAARASTNKKVGILVTQATANNIRFQKLIAAHSNGAEVFIQPCPGLVELIEVGNIAGVEISTLLERFLSPLLNQGIDKLVLGCTHYPMITKQIKALVGDSVELIDTALPVAKQLINKLTEHNLLADKKTAEDIWYSTKVITPNLINQRPWQLLTIA